jgi:hypothetical protein
VASQKGNEIRDLYPRQDQHVDPNLVSLRVLEVERAMGIEPTRAAIFDVTVNSAGIVQTLKVAKVIDPDTHSTDTVNVAVPDSYLGSTIARVLRIAQIFC